MEGLSEARQLCEHSTLVLIPHGEKGPREKEWHKKPLSVSQFDYAFASSPSPNIGIILGSHIDVECDGPEAEIDLRELFDGEPPQTVSWTSRRGPHYLFAANERLLALGTAVIKWKSVEVRVGGAKAAQSLIPPSTTDGFTRTWIVPPSQCLPSKLPDSVVDKLLLTAERKKMAVVPGPRRAAPLERPGDDLIRHVSWADVLAPHGWKAVNESDGVTHWCRPGKSDGVSATTGYCSTEDGKDLLFCFSTNAMPFEEGHTYDKFAAYALLNHKGDFTRAAAALAQQGYGHSAKPSASAVLIEIGETASLFHSPESECFATVPAGGHHETYRIESRDFKRWLEHQYYLKTKKAPTQKAMSEAIGVLAAKASFEGQTFEVHTRIARFPTVIYLDLCNDRWEVVEITAAGWQVMACPTDVKFRRPKGMLPLPTPATGGCIDELRPFVNLDDRSWSLFVASLIGVFANGPYVIALILSGHGTGKTTTMRHGRQVIDPNVAEVRAAPHDVEKLMLAATNGACVCIDNADNVNPWLASALCRVSTGGGFGTRELYTNDGEHLFNVMRPVWITGITDLTEREDFLSRCIILRCPPLVDSERRAEGALNSAFEKARPGILGAILTAVSAGIRNLPSVDVPRLPRMADWFKWSIAVQEGLGWDSNEFKKHFEASQEEIRYIALDNPIADAIRKLVPLGTSFVGTSQQLLAQLNAQIGNNPPADWPRGPQVLSAKLNRLKNDLAAVGIEVTQHRREWTIKA